MGIIITIIIHLSKVYDYAAHDLLIALPVGGFPLMAEITRILTANTRRQFSFVVTTTAKNCCLVGDFKQKGCSVCRDSLSFFCL